MHLSEQFRFRCRRCGHAFERPEPSGLWRPKCKSVKVVPRVAVCETPHGKLPV